MTVTDKSICLGCLKGFFYEVGVESPERCPACLSKYYEENSPSEGELARLEEDLDEARGDLDDARIDLKEAREEISDLKDTQTNLLKEIRSLKRARPKARARGKK